MPWLCVKLYSCVVYAENVNLLSVNKNVVKMLARRLSRSEYRENYVYVCMYKTKSKHEDR
jgi:hypothetical protein